MSNPVVKIMANSLPPERAGKRSVTSGDSDLVHIVIPFQSRKLSALPTEIPVSNHFYGFNKERDQLLLSTPKHEAQWAGAITTAISRTASMSWEIDSEVPLRRKRVQDILLNFHAGMGVYGWVPALSVGLRGFLTIGYQIIEIERASGARGSRPVAIHHLNPLKCSFTGDDKHPIEYLNGDGESYKLPWHDLMIIVDTLKTEDDGSVSESAAERAYPQIKKLAAIENYVYEKVSGSRPQAIYFIGGATQSTISDAVSSTEISADQKSLSSSYMGAAMVPVMGDSPVTIATIPLAELPDGFEAEPERLRADLIYAHAIGIDPQAVNPQLLGGQGLGSTGNQSQVLENKEKQSGLSAWRQQFSHQVNMMLLDDRTTFAFKEVDYKDRAQDADIAKTLGETASAMVNGGLISPEQATNYLVDKDVLTVNFARQETTAGTTVNDNQKIDRENESKGKIPTASATNQNTISPASTRLEDN